MSKEQAALAEDQTVTEEVGKDVEITLDEKFVVSEKAWFRVGKVTTVK